MNHPVEHFIQAVLRRRQRERLWQAVSHGLLAGGLTGLLMAVVRRMAGPGFSGLWVAAVIIVPVLVSVVRAWSRFPAPLTAARDVDRRLKLQDRTATALQFLALRSGMSDLQRLQVDEAGARICRLNASDVVPIEMPRTWKPALMATLVATLLAGLTSHPDSAGGSAIADEAVMGQAEQVAGLLTELRELNERTPDPRLEQLIQELRQISASLEAPAASPRDALATLSEMDSALQTMRKQLEAASGDLKLREIGAALSLAAPLAEAGQALARGDLNRAADQLERVELPTLDRATRTAMSERLQEVAKSETPENTKSRLQEASRKLSEGVSAQEADKFREGARELAAESRQQSRNRQLAQELAKQSRKMNDARSALESELRSRAQAQRSAGQSGSRPAENAQKGGRQAGRGSTAMNDRGNGTRKAGDEMRLTGEDTGAGDSEKESTSRSELTPGAVQRGYQPSPGRVTALDEVALESEAIPPGYRQTIRRYFELIRPADGTQESAASAAERDEPPGSETVRP